MRCKKKKKNIKLKIFITIGIIAIAIFCYFDFHVNPQIINANLAQIKSVSTHIINTGVQHTIQNNQYEDLMNIQKDNNNKVTLITVNSKNVNQLNSSIISITQQKLEEEQNLQINVPLGNFSGIPILNGLGSNVAIKLTPIGSVTTKFVSQFSSVGINQTIHKIYINITATVCVLLPLYTQNINVTSQILVGECIIVGEIPNVYLNTDNLTNALNLIP